MSGKSNRSRLLWAWLWYTMGGAACQRPPAPPQDVRQIAILQLGTHDVIDAVVNGLDRRLYELYGGTVRIVRFNANFDATNLSLMSRQISTSSVAAVVTVTTPASLAFVGADRGAHPLVFSFVSDPSALGYKGVGTLKNTTGLSDQVDYAGVLDLVEKVRPGARSIGYLLTRSESNARVIHEGFQREAEARGLIIKTAEITSPTDVRAAAEALSSSVDCFLFGGDNTVASNIGALLDVASRRRLPIFANDEASVVSGAVAGISVDYIGMGARTAEVVAFVLSGARPDSLSMEVLKAKRVVVNRAAAARLGLTIPQEIVTKADRVIE